MLSRGINAGPKWRFLKQIFFADTKSIEGLLSLASLWVAYCLFFGADFDTNRAYAIMGDFDWPEQVFGAYFLAASLIKLAGLALYTTERAPHSSSLLRQLGALLSFAGWMLIGCSFYNANEYSLSSGIIMLLSTAAAWVMIRNPSVG